MNNQSPMPSIKEIIFQAFGVTLPIRGGMGNSMENAVIIECSSLLSKTNYLKLKTNYVRTCSQ
jgi:hypothetical protein